MDRIKVIINYGENDTIEYGIEQIKSIVITNRTSNDPNNYFTGIISQFTNIELYDINKDIFNRAQQKTLRQDLPVKITCFDKIIANLNIEKFEYQWGSFVVSITLKDELLRWDSMFYNGFADNPNNIAETFFNDLVIASGETITVDNIKRQYLRDIKLPDSFLSSGNFRERFDEFLSVVGMVIYKNRIGDIVGIRV
jgi:hypothetical protein